MPLEPVPRHRLALATAATGLFLAHCGLEPAVQVVQTGPAMMPLADDCSVEVRSLPPTDRAYRELCLLTARGRDGTEDLIASLRRRACGCGADALVITGVRTPHRITALEATAGVLDALAGEKKDRDPGRNDTQVSATAIRWIVPVPAVPHAPGATSASASDVTDATAASAPLTAPPTTGRERRLGAAGVVMAARAALEAHVGAVAVFSMKDGRTLSGTLESANVAAGKAMLETASGRVPVDLLDAATVTFPDDPPQ
jgi:hypothetical protein